VKRIWLVAILCSAISMTIAAAQHSTAAPELKFSVYAIVQKDSPLQVIGFERGLEHLGGIQHPDDIQLILANRGDKVISGAVIVARITPPSGCSSGEARTVELSSGTDIKQLNLAPHQTMTLRQPSPVTFTSFVKAAQIQQIAAAQVQVGVTQVDFADGTLWRPDPDPRLQHPMAPFLPSLVEMDAGMCSSPDAVLSALSNVTAIRPERGEKPLESSTATVQESPTPHIVFRCRLEEMTAICPSH
jgi:hypothetical protein